MNFNFKAYSLVLLPFLLASCGGGEQQTVDNPITSVLNVNEIAGKRIEEVEKKLGKGTFEKNWKDQRAGCVSCPKYIYKNGQVEVIFIQDVADRITINNLGQYSYPSEALPAIGLENMETEFTNDMVTRWRSINGYREISAFNGQNNKVDYVLVLTKAN